MSAIFDIIRVPFGWLINKFFVWTGSYVVAVLLFALVVKLLLFPFSIKQQKNSQKQAKLRPKENVIRKKYAGRNDNATKMKLNTEIQELYQKENFSMFAGCLPLFLSLLVLLAVYAVIRTPLTYTASLPKVRDDFSTAEMVKQTVATMVYEDKASGENKYPDFQIKDFVSGNGAYDFASMDERAKREANTNFYKSIYDGKFNLYIEINSINFIDEYRDDFVKNAKKYSNDLLTDEAIQQIVKEGTVPDLEVFEGFNLGTVPQLNFITNKELKIGTKLLLIIPLLNLVTSYFGQAITKKFTYQSEMAKDQEGSMKVMNVFMPLFSLFISFSIPTAVSLYWVVQNILGPIQQIVLSKLYPIPVISEEEMKEAEKLYGGKPKKKKPNPANSSGKKKKSLVYDDDDEYQSISSLSELKEVKEKDDEGDSIVDKAPLKKD